MFQVSLTKEIMRPTNPYVFGYRIAILRRALSWTQDFADRMLHAGKGVVRQHEAGRRKWPRLPLLRRLRYLEGIYAEEIKSYLAVAGDDTRKRIHCRPGSTGRPPDLQEALGRMGTVGFAGSLSQTGPFPAGFSGIRTDSKSASRNSRQVNSAGGGHADDTTNQPG